MALANLLTPELVLQVAEAAEDYRITATELSEIMGTVTSIFAGVAIAGLVGMLTGAIFRGFTKETGIKMEKRAGVPIPIME
ncbi:unnamed protein product [marine sediment metagenome]|uniref:Uncharacterized protein n=1 Tax=marine sediment metagenome TaxID=412755 RepID=X1RQF8_9ZZZZ